MLSTPLTRLRLLNLPEALSIQVNLVSNQENFGFLFVYLTRVLQKVFQNFQCRVFVDRINQQNNVRMRIVDVPIVLECIATRRVPDLESQSLLPSFDFKFIALDELSCASVCFCAAFFDST